MAKILRILNRFNLGGPTYNAAYLTKYMSPEFETMLIGGCRDEAEKDSEYIVRSLGIEPVIIPEMRREIDPVKDVVAYNKIKKIIKEFKPDIVHTHASKAGVLGRYAAKSAKVPIIVHTFHGHIFHSYFNSYKSMVFKTIERNLANKSSKIIAVSEFQKYELTEVYKIVKPEKVEVINLGFDLEQFQKNIDEKRQKFRAEFNIKDDEIAIGIIGRIVPIKNHNLFLKGVKYLMDNTSKKVRIFIVGDGESKEAIMQKAKELNIDFVDTLKSNKVATLTFTSWRKDIDVVNAGLDIIALTSLNEGTPVSIIEAQASNKAIIATNVGGIKDIVIENETAILTKNADEEDFAKKLLELVENEELRNKLSKNSYDFVKQKFHYTTLVKNMSKLYNNLLNN